MVAFIDQYRDTLGVEPICKHLPIAPSTYYEHKARAADPERLPARVNRQFAATRPNQLWVADFTFGAPSLQRCH